MPKAKSEQTVIRYKFASADVDGTVIVERYTCRVGKVNDDILLFDREGGGTAWIEASRMHTTPAKALESILVQASKELEEARETIIKLERGTRSLKAALEKKNWKVAEYVHGAHEEE